MADPFSIETWRKIFKRYGRVAGWGLSVVFGLPLVVGFGLSQFMGGGKNSSAANQSDSIATVNGDVISAADLRAARASVEARMRSQSQSSIPEQGPEYAAMEGMALNEAIEQVVIEQEARKRHVQPSNADIDAAVAQERDRAGKNLTDSQWADYLSEYKQGVTPDEFRDIIARSIVPRALLESFKKAQNVTEQDARQQNSQVKYDIVLISTAGPGGLPGSSTRSLPDAAAKAKAEALRNQARSGADIAAIARANSAAFSAKQGGIETRPEYQTSPNMPETFGALGYGKDFDAAVHATPTGQFTDLVKVSGIQQGYAFARILDRTLTTPKGFDAKKAVDDLKTKRALAQLEALIRDDLKAAKVKFSDADEKVYYDYVKQEMDSREAMMAQFSHTSTAGSPSQDDIKKEEDAVNAEFEQLLKRHPDDATAALILAQNLKQSRNPADAIKNRDRLVGLYEVALRTVEDHNVRFELAGYYIEKNDIAKATAQYERIARLLAVSPPYDVPTIQQALPEHQRLVGAFRSVNKPDEAAKEQAVVEKLTKQLADEKKKSAADAAAAMPNAIAKARAAAPGTAGLNAAAPHPAQPGAATPTSSAPPARGQ